MSNINYKFILLGNTGVGKSSIFRYLSSGCFKADTISTIGVDKKTLYYSYEIEELQKMKKIKRVKKDFTISLFDTSGQERYRAITRNYYKSAEGILLLYDITNRNSFESVESLIEQIKSSISGKLQSDYLIILIGNKLDLVKENITERKVTEKEAKDICNKYDIIWGEEQSIKDIKFEELNKLFERYVKLVYNIVGDKNKKKQKEIKVDKYKKKRKCI